MKKSNLISFLSCFILIGCHTSLSTDTSKNDINEAISEEYSSFTTQSSSDMQIGSNEPALDSSSNEAIIDLISSSSDSSTSAKDAIDEQKEYYRSLINREEIIYSTQVKNDVNYQVDQLNIYSINDTHGALYTEGNNVTGLDKVETVINSTKTSEYNSVFIANGDIFQGSAFSNMLYGEPAISAFNEMKLDAFIIGNHEFDWGLDKIAQFKDGNEDNGELQCSFLGANILNKDNKMPDWIKPYSITQKGNLKVGIIGIIGDGQESSIAKDKLDGYHFSSTIEAVNKYSKILKEEEKVDVILLASHDHDESKNAIYVKSNAIDAIINAHDHRFIEEYVTRYDGYNVPVIESGSKNYYVGKTTLNIENKMVVNGKMTHYYPSNYASNAKVKLILDIYYKVMKEFLLEVVTQNSQGYSKEETGILGSNILVDYYKEVDFAFLNQTGIRSSLPSGKLTIGDIFAAFTFDNCVAITEMSGSELKTFFTKYASNYYFSSNLLTNSSTLDMSKFDSNNTYKIATFDFVATNYMSSYFDDFHQAVFTNDILRDLVINYLKKC